MVDGFLSRTKAGPPVTLVDRIAACLQQRPLTAPEIARELRVRDIGVRAALRSDSRFVLVPAPAGRAQQGRFWTTTTESVRPDGTSSLVPEGVVRPVEGLSAEWWLEGPRTVGEAIQAAEREEAA